MLSKSFRPLLAPTVTEASQEPTRRIPISLTTGRPPEGSTSLKNQRVANRQVPRVRLDSATTTNTSAKTATSASRGW